MPLTPKAPDNQAPAAASPMKTLSGDAEKLRLTLTGRNPTLSQATALGRTFEVKKLGVDSARKSLRFIVHRCEIVDAGLRVTLPSGEARSIPFAGIVGVVARQLPLDPPWDGALILDVVPSVDVSPEPVRIFATTVVGYAAIPGGASASRLDNTRRLVAFLQEKCPAAVLDEPTQEFMRGPKGPLRFASMTQFIEYDISYH